MDRKKQLGKMPALFEAGLLIISLFAVFVFSGGGASAQPGDMTVGVTTDKGTYLPGETVTATVTVLEGAQSSNLVVNGDFESVVPGGPWTAGKVNNGVNFDGSDDYIMTAPTPFVGNSGSLSAWVYPRAQNFFGTIIGQGFSSVGATNPTFFIGLYQDGRVYCRASGSTDYEYTSASTYTTNTWTMLTMTWTPTTLTLYKNGVSVFSQTGLNINFAASNQEFYFGRYGDVSQYYFNGIIDEAYIFNRAVTASEVSQLYTNTAISTTGLVGLWHFDEISGTTAHDGSGNNHDGAFYGFGGASPVVVGWTQEKLNQGTWNYQLKQESGNTYLEVSKDWWGENRFVQDVPVTSADLDVSARMKPTSVPSSGNTQLAVSLIAYKAGDVAAGAVFYYYRNQGFSTGQIIKDSDNIPSDPNLAILFSGGINAMQYCYFVQMPTNSWTTISYNVKEKLDAINARNAIMGRPQIDLNSITKLRIYATVYYTNAQGVATCDFDDISLTGSTIIPRPNEQVTFGISNPSGTVIGTDNIITGPDGKAVYQFTLPSDAAAGTYAVDASIQTASASTTFAVANIPPNPPTPIAPADNVWSRINTPTFEWSFTDQNNDQSGGYNIQISGDSSFSTIDYEALSEADGVTSHQFSSAISDGVWYWRVKAKDANEAWSDWSVTMVLKIDTVSPVANAGADQTVVAGTTVQFDGTASYDPAPGSGIADYTWTFMDQGNQITRSGLTLAYTFANAGTYEVTLTVTDVAGNPPSTDICIVTVTPSQSTYEQMIQDCIQQAQQLPSNKNVDNAIGEMNNALALASVGDYLGSFAAVKKAIQQLEVAKKKGIDTTVIIADLTEAVRYQTQSAILGAGAAGGIQQMSLQNTANTTAQKAQQMYDNGLKMIAKGNYIAAIEQFMQAYKTIVKA